MIRLMMGFRKTQHLFCHPPLDPVSSSTYPLNLSLLSLSAPYFPISPVRTPTQMEQQQPVVPLGATVGSRPTPSYPVSTGVQKCFGVQTECRGTGGRANLDALLHSDCLAPRTTQTSKIPHICHHTRLTTNSNQSTIVG